MEAADSKRALVATIPVSLLLVLTGSCNTLLAKWADSIHDLHGVPFEHPFFQSFCMFLGEFSCLGVYFLLHWVRKRQWRRKQQQQQQQEARNERQQSPTRTLVAHDEEDRVQLVLMPPDESAEPKVPWVNPLVFLVPVGCDVISSCMLYTALNLTSPSSYQMLRGSAIIFTGLLTVAFLRTPLLGYRWLGMGLVAIGLGVVGLSDILLDEDPMEDVNSVLTGDLLIIVAQVVTATQMVSEQKFLVQYDVPPLLAVGIEDLFGMAMLALLIVPMHFVRVPSTFSKNPDHRLEDVPFALHQIHEQPTIGIALVLMTISVTLSKELSATTRMVLDSIRTVLIWMFSIALFHEQFIPLQLLGFALLLLGMFIYNDLWIGPHFRRRLLLKVLALVDGNGNGECRWAHICASFCCGSDDQGGEGTADWPNPDQERLLTADEETRRDGQDAPQIGINNGNNNNNAI